MVIQSTVDLITNTISDRTKSPPSIFRLKTVPSVAKAVVIPTAEIPVIPRQYSRPKPTATIRLTEIKLEIIIFFFELFILFSTFLLRYAQISRTIMPSIHIAFYNFRVYVFFSNHISDCCAMDVAVDHFQLEALLNQVDNIVDKSPGLPTSHVVYINRDFELRSIVPHFNFGQFVNRENLVEAFNYLLFIDWIILLSIKTPVHLYR